jgi:hypothetical protein
MQASLGMVCGGTGVTPIYQVVNAVLKNPRDKTKVRGRAAGTGLAGQDTGAGAGWREQPELVGTARAAQG